MGGKRVENAIGRLRANGIPNFSFPDSAVSALDKFYGWSQNSMAKNSQIAKINEKRKANVQSIINIAKNEKRKALYFNESSVVILLEEL